MQSFLGSLNYYSRFIEDFAVYASVLYELREADFHEINRIGEVPNLNSAARSVVTHEEIAVGDRDLYPKPEADVDRYPTAGIDRDCEGRNRWEKATIAFALLQSKIATTPILKHFGSDRSPVIVMYASKWAISAALLQEYDGVYWPVTFFSRTLSPMKSTTGWWRKKCWLYSGC